MNKGNKSVRAAWIALATAAAAAVGVVLTAALTDGGLSYTEPRANPSESAALIAIPEQRRQPLPEMTFSDARGRVRTSADFKGRVVLLNLWATWCPPCVAEMPALNRVQGLLGNGPAFEVVAVSLDRGGTAVVTRWFDSMGMKHLAPYAATNPGDFAGAAIPESLLIDSHGRIAWRGLGQRPWDGEAGLALLRAIIAER